MSLFDGLRQIWEVATLGEEEVGAQMQRLIVTGERCWELVQERGGSLWVSPGLIRHDELPADDASAHLPTLPLPCFSLL